MSCGRTTEVEHYNKSKKQNIFDGQLNFADSQEKILKHTRNTMNMNKFY